ncbi:MAG: hypothetical protein N2C14_29425, partial [Planctomycetales bacterium]
MFRRLACFALLAFRALLGCSGNEEAKPLEQAEKVTAEKAEKIEPGTETPQGVMRRMAEAFETGNVELYLSVGCPADVSAEYREYYRAAYEVTLTAVSLEPLLARIEKKYGKEELRSALNALAANTYEKLWGRSRHVDFGKLATEGELEQSGDFFKVTRRS